MEQLLQDYESFAKLDTEIIVLGPEDANQFRKYWQKHDLPFIGLPDPEHTVLERYGQQVRLLKLGRMPAQIIVDRHGQIRFAHYSHSMRDIPSNRELLQLLEKLD